MQNFIAIGSVVSPPQIRDFAVPFDVTNFLVFWLFNACNGDTACITQLKQQKSKSDIPQEHVDILAMSCKSNSIFLIFPVLVVWQAVSPLKLF